MRAAADAAPDERRRLQDEVALINVGVAESLARRYQSRGESLDDLIQVATVGLMKSVRGFDPDKADDFLSYAVPTITGEIKRHFRDRGWMVRPPRHIQDLQASISHASSEVAQEVGRSPTVGEIAEHLGEDEEDVIEALACDGCFAPASIDSRAKAGEGAAIADLIGAEDQGYEQADAIAALAPVCRELGERDRRILYLRFFKGWSQQEIADVLGISQMQVSRLLTRILSNLREKIGGREPQQEPNDRRAGDRSSQPVPRQRVA